MKVRRLNENDVKQYHKIRLEALKNSPEAFSSSYQEEIEKPIEVYRSRLASTEGSITFGYEDNDQVCGVITVVKENKAKLNHRVMIVSTYVIPEKRGQGIGKVLVQEAIQQAKRLDGIEQVYLTVANNNEKAKKLYRYFGFELFGTEKKALKFENKYFDIDHMVLYF
ncbi:Protein N-acetyltransferase, RimJ/RimL family [Oceanobacillus limi]|uniref:Protein N-acetyltransferase, RimJ/RimL family n=1 Tax=Oceanobacillus limi TaxID=930131 RepID=A0A1H9YD42_9BACI|nr:GNAT family N-acetyltransferase [Oceanobacillus limi]SES66852.1 Protein N-acetyltransferase, RimJ/RimL family [Oceanobacillus limi]